MHKIAYCVVMVLSMLSMTNGYFFRVKVDTTKCPIVKAMRNFELDQLLGQWYVVQYYASSEEDLSYKCMRADFTKEDKIISTGHQMEITMNFTYAFINDPLSEQLLGNITWQVPDALTPAQWVHAEETYEGIYNTYVLDTDYTSWTLLMHCAEKENSTRYFSSFIMSRGMTLPNNVISYLRDKLPKYGIDLDFMFNMSQDGCENNGMDFMPKYSLPNIPGLAVVNRKRGSRRRHPLKRVHKVVAGET